MFSGVVGGRRVGLTNVAPSYPDFLEIWDPEATGTPRTCPGGQWDSFTFTFGDVKFL